MAKTLQAELVDTYELVAGDHVIIVDEQSAKTVIVLLCPKLISQLKVRNSNIARKYLVGLESESHLPINVTITPELDQPFLIHLQGKAVRIHNNWEETSSWLLTCNSEILRRVTQALCEQDSETLASCLTFFMEHDFDSFE